MRKNFEYYEKLGVDQQIRVQINSVTGKCAQHSRIVREQLWGGAGRHVISIIGIEERIANRKAWAKRVGYGYGKTMTIIWHMLTNDKPYESIKPKLYARKLKKRSTAHKKQAEWQ